MLFFWFFISYALNNTYWFNTEGLEEMYIGLFYYDRELKPLKLCK